LASQEVSSIELDYMSGVANIGLMQQQYAKFLFLLWLLAIHT